MVRGKKAYSSQLLEYRAGDNLEMRHALHADGKIEEQISTFESFGSLEEIL